MSDSAIPCKNCGAEIQAITAQLNDGLCMPCKSGRRPKVRGTYEDVDTVRRLDSQCVTLIRDSDKPDTVDYFFESDVWDKDPRFRSRWMIVGVNRGLLRLSKKTGEIELLQPMSEDVENKRFHRASRRITQHWQVGETPERTQFACG